MIDSREAGEMVGRDWVKGYEGGDSRGGGGGRGSGWRLVIIISSSRLKT